MTLPGNIIQTCHKDMETHELDAINLKRDAQTRGSALKVNHCQWRLECCS